MTDTRAASRYVKSLLGLAVEQNVLEQVHDDMVMFKKITEQNRDFYLLMRNPIVRHEKKREILERIFKGRVHSLTMAIFDIITRKNREPLLPAIAEEFHNAYNEYKGIGKATLITAAPVDAATRAEFEKLAMKYSEKKAVELHQQVDPDMIGGFVLNVGDKQVDASLKNKLKALKVKFSQNPYVKEF